jgi:uncharacterized repeat protein (TIGR01451 family)
MTPTFATSIRYRLHALALLAAIAIAAAPASRAATITVHTHPVSGAGMVLIADDGLCSLREAIINANNNAATHPDCAAGSGSSNTLVLPAGAAFTLPDAAVADGLGQTGLVDDAGEFRLLYVLPQGRLTVQDLTLANACASGNIDNHTDAANGGAILSRGELNLRRSWLSGNSAGMSGGGVGQQGVTLIETSTLTGNWSTIGGAVMSAAGSTTVRNSTLSNNVAGTGGGAITAVNSTLHLEHSTLVDNTSTDGGGVMGGFFATLRLKNTVLQNSACVHGVMFFGVALEWSASGSNIDSGSSCLSLTMANVTPNTNAILGPLASNGGTTRTHALLPGSPARNAANDCTAIGNSAIAADQRGMARPQAGVCDIGAFEAHSQPLSGAVIHVDAVEGTGVVPVLGDGLCSLREAIENANSASASFAHGDCEPGSPNGIDNIVLPGGAVFTLTDAAITAPFGNTGLPAVSTLIAIRGHGATIQSGNACNFNGTQSAGEFRFFLLQSGSLGLERLSLVNGCADGAGSSSARDGGAIYVQGGVLVTDEVTLRANRARRGGAIFSAGTVLVEESALHGNTATFGGALFASGTATLSNTTVSGNFATSLGGAAFIESGATLGIEQSTLDANSSGQSNAIYSSTSTVNLKNTILHNSRCDQNGDLGPSIWNASGSNLDDGNTCASLFGANVAPNTNPRIAPLADNGGGTRTHALLPGSPAIDAAASCTKLGGAAVLRDQRGIARPQGAVCDIGAFESRGFTLTASAGNGQVTTVGTAFAAPLVVQVGSAFGEPVDGGRVSFLAPASGASLGTIASLVSVSGGQASLAVTANGIAGSYVVTADARGSSAAANFSLSNLAVGEFEVTAAVVFGQGSITPAMQTVLAGGTASFTVTPEPGWAVDEVSGDSCSPAPVSGSSWQATGIQSNCSVLARFTATATDLQIAKDSGVDAALDGQVLVYAITVANAGPASVSGAQLVDILPASLIEAEWACLPAESSAACPSAPFDAGTGDLYAEIDLPVDGFLRYDLSARVQTDGGTSLVSNTATVTPPAGIDELDPSNNSATDSTSVVPEGIFASGFEAGPDLLAVPAATKAQRESAGR